MSGLIRWSAVGGSGIIRWSAVGGSGIIRWSAVGGSDLIRGYTLGVSGLYAEKTNVQRKRIDSCVTIDYSIKLFTSVSLYKERRISVNTLL